MLDEWNSVENIQIEMSDWNSENIPRLQWNWSKLINVQANKACSRIWLPYSRQNMHRTWHPPKETMPNPDHFQPVKFNKICKLFFFVGKPIFGRNFDVLKQIFTLNVNWKFNQKINIFSNLRLANRNGALYVFWRWRSRPLHIHFHHTAQPRRKLS